MRTIRKSNYLTRFPFPVYLFSKSSIYTFFHDPSFFSPVEPGGRYTALGLGAVMGGATALPPPFFSSSPFRTGVAGLSGKVPGSAGRNSAAKRLGPSAHFISCNGPAPLYLNNYIHVYVLRIRSERCRMSCFECEANYAGPHT